jgi:hypothetical protein
LKFYINIVNIKIYILSKFVISHYSILFPFFALSFVQAATKESAKEKSLFICYIATLMQRAADAIHYMLFWKYKWYFNTLKMGES